MIEIRPADKLDARIAAPPSKAHTLRALFIAGLAKGKSTLENPLFAEDQLLAVKALKLFGAKIEIKKNNFEIVGVGGKPVAPAEPVFLGNSGVSIRFASSVAGLANGKTVLTGSPRMKQRPIGELIAGLRQLGVQARHLEKDNFAPVEITGSPHFGGKAVIGGKESSQFFSSILVAAPYAKKDVELEVRDCLSSAPYLDLTLDVMKHFGVTGENRGYCSFRVKAGQQYTGRRYRIEGDFSSASYFFAAAAVTGGKMKISNLDEESKQPDKKMLGLLKKMGCAITWKKTAVEVRGPRTLAPIDADMNSCPDVVPTMAVVAAFAPGRSILHNVEQLKHKESDRLAAICEELGKMGIKAYEKGNDLVVEGGNPRGATIDSHDDHRIAMAFSVAGLKTPGVRISNEAAVGKSFPDFFERISELTK